MIVADYLVVIISAVSVTVLFLLPRAQVCVQSLAEHWVCVSQTSGFVLFCFLLTRVLPCSLV